MDIDKILQDIQKKIENYGNKKLIENLRKSTRVWKLTVKEKDLLFTLKVILEMKIRGLNFPSGIDFNHSEEKEFKIENDTIYFPFTAITGIGGKIAEKIISYRKEKGLITNWRENLTSLLNTNHIQKLENLEKHKLIIK